MELYLHYLICLHGIHRNGFTFTLNPLKPSCCMHTRFNIYKFYVLPTQCIYVFCVDLRTNSDYSLYSINWMVFITEMERVYCAVRTVSLNLIEINLTFVLNPCHSGGLVLGLSHRRPWFEPGPVHLNFVLDKVTPRPVFLQVLHCNFNNVLFSLS
jgi:hypothetical protein